MNTGYPMSRLFCQTWEFPVVRPIPTVRTSPTNFILFSKKAPPGRRHSIGVGLSTYDLQPLQNNTVKFVFTSMRYPVIVPETVASKSPDSSY
jgi:hypothetical protein